MIASINNDSVNYGSIMVVFFRQTSMVGLVNGGLVVHSLDNSVSVIDYFGR